MTSKIILDKLIHDLDLLKGEIIQYKSESDLWVIKGEIKNPSGNLVLHLTGNLKHYIGAVLGNTGYVRQRDREFSDRNISREKLLQGLDEAVSVLKKALPMLTDEDLQKPYPGDWGGKKLNNMELLVNVITHFNYHLGQVNYHRRLL